MVTSLTLIPPSPVTDKIKLDIRGAIWNRTDKKETYCVNVYLDNDSEHHLIHKQTMEVNPNSCKGIKFRWQTKGHAGKHRLVFAARSDSHTTRTSRRLEIIASDTRSTKRIDGGWFEFYHWSEKEGMLWNKDIINLTEDQWKELVEGMHNIGMNIIVIQDTYHNPDRYVGKHNMEKDGFPGLSYYPSEIYPKNPKIAAADPLEAVLTQADKHGMYVMIGVGGYAWFDFTPGSVQWHKKIADELWEMYGHHRSFYGWYVSEEIAGNLGANDTRRRQIVEFFREFKEHVTKLAPDKPVMLATNCHLIGQSGDYYPKLLEYLDIICPFGFHRMPQNDYSGEKAASVLQDYCDQAGSHLWMDLEIFLFGSRGELYPRPIKGIVDDLMRFPDFEKICCYSYTGLMNSPEQSRKPGGVATVDLYNDYKKFLIEGPPATSVNHQALGQKIKLTYQSSPRYSKGDLTDGNIAGKDYLSRHWLGFENSDLIAIVDFEQVVKIKCLKTCFLQDKRGAIFLPSKVEYLISENGRDYQSVAVLNNEISKNRSGAFIHSFEKTDLDINARYIRICAKSAGQWLFSDEIIVNPFPKTH